MSLINDALKRASQAQKLRGTPAPTGRPLQPAASGSPSRNVLIVIVPLVAVVLLVTAGWFTWQWWQHRPAVGPVPAAAMPVTASPPAETNAASVSAPPTAKLVINTNLVVRPAPAAVAKAAPTAGVPAPTKAAPVAAASPASIPNLAAAVAEAAAPVEFPPLKLQAVYLRMTKPSVLLNGQLLYVGDTFDDVKIVAIDRQSVTVEYRGQRKVLMPK